MNIFRRNKKFPHTLELKNIENVLKVYSILIWKCESDWKCVSDWKCDSESD